MKRHLYLDLEGTIIDLWDSETDAVRNQQIYDIMHSVEWHSINIFSFAIDNGIDEDIFNIRWRPQLEKIYDKPFDNIITTRMVCMEVINGCDGVAQHYVKCRIGKETSFIKYMNNAAHPGDECVLIDDLVTTSYMHNLERNVLVKMLNVVDVTEQRSQVAQVLTFGISV